MFQRQKLTLIIFFYLSVCLSNLASANIIDTSICSGSAVNISSLIPNADKYTWSTGDTTRSINVRPSFTSLYRVVSIILQDTLVDTVRVVIIDYPSRPILTFSDSSISVKNPERLDIKWFKNNIELTSKKDTLRYPTEGVYKAHLGNNKLCWTSSDPIYLTKDYDTTKPSMELISYPNPSNGSFNLYINLGKKLSQQLNIKIINASGAELYASSFFMYQSDNVKLPISLPFGTKGQVLISCTVNNKVTTKQQIIN